MIFLGLKIPGSRSCKPGVTVIEHDHDSKYGQRKKSGLLREGVRLGNDTK